MKKLLKWLLILTTALAICVVVILYHPGLFKGPLERYLSDLTGYSISLNGDLILDVGMSSKLTATNIHVAAPEWAHHRDMEFIEFLAVTLETGSLFKDIIVLESIQIKGSQLNLETNTGGIGNWLNTNPPVQATATDETPPVVIVRDLQLLNSGFRFRNGKTNAEHLLLVSSLKQQQRANGMLEFNVEGRFNDRSVKYAGEIGPYKNLLQGQNITLSGQGQLGTLTMTGNGLIDDLLSPRRPRFRLEAQGPNIDEITEMFGVDDLGNGEFSLLANGDDLGDHYETSISGEIGDVTLSASAQVSDLSKLDEVDMSLLINGPSLGAFTRVFGVNHWPDKPFHMKGDIERIGGTLNISGLSVDIGSTHAELDALLSNFPSLEAGRIKLSVVGDDVAQFRDLLGIPGIATGAFEINGRLDVSPGMVELLQFEGQTSLGRITLSGNLSAAPGYSDSKFRLHLQGHNAHTLMSAFDIGALPDLPYDLSGQVQIVKGGFQLGNVRAKFADIDLAASGLISSDKDLLETAIDFQINGENLSSLEMFPAIGDSLDIFAPGQAYKASGHIAIGSTGWVFSNIDGRIGSTDIKLDGRVDNQPGHPGPDFRFSIKGPGLNGLLADQVAPELLSGHFESSGRVELLKDTLNITDFNVETLSTKVEIDLTLGWPLGDSLDADFDVNVRGKDIRQVIPPTESFQFELLPYEIKAVGKKHGDMLALKHVDASIGNLKVSMKGGLDEETKDESLDVTFNASSKDISALGHFNGDRLPAIALNIDANFKGNTQQFKVDNLSGSLGDSLLEGSLDVSLIGPKPDINLMLNSKYIDTRPFLRSTDSDDEAEPGANSDRLIPAIPLPLNLLASTDLSINLKIAELKLQNGHINNLDLDAKMLKGSLEVSQLYLEGPLGSLRTSLFIKPTDSSNADVNLNLVAENLVLNLTNQSEQYLHQLPVLDVHGEFSGKGSNLRELAGSLNGAIYLGSNGGILKGVNLRLVDTFILDEIFSLILPTSDSKDDLVISCAATLLEITDGLVETNPALAFTTDQIALVAKGTLDLKTEKMNFNFTATPNKALKVSASEFINSFILVSGTLAKPVVGLDPARVLIQGGAAIGTVGISLLAKGLIDRVGNTAPLCEQMLKRKEPLQ